jgi:hypothetical protein
MVFGLAFTMLLSALAAVSAGEARSNDGGGVRVVVTPVALGPAIRIWEFEVTMDTHTRPLSEDLAKATVLVDNLGRRFTPIAWEGDPPGGHHRKGVLRFAAPQETPDRLEMQMDSVGGVNSRVFRWSLK